MTPDKKIIQDDELDLVELLGVIIRHRRFIAYFVMALTLISVLFFCFREYKKSVTVEKSYKLENSVSTDKDAVFATYMFLKKGKERVSDTRKEEEKDEYNRFLSVILFPSKIDAPSFEIMNKREPMALTYLFHTEEESKAFMSRYNSFVNLLGKISEYKMKLGDEAFSNCRQFNNSIKGNVLDKNLMLFFKNTEDMRICNLFNYYYTLVQGRITYALPDSTTISDAYIPFIIDFVNEGTEKSKLTPTIRTEESKNEIKIKAKFDFNIRKVIKYSMLMFVISLILSVFVAFLMEFWKSNKTRLNKYWRE